MMIRLMEIPEEGKSFELNSQTKELNEILADLIGNTAYKTHFFIKPLNSKDYMLTGTIETAVPDQCSRCGLDFNFKIKKSFQEVIIPHQYTPRDAQFSKVNHLSDSNEQEISVIEYQNSMFDIGEYLHEIIGLSIPLNPAPEVDDKDQCGVCHLTITEKSFSYEEALPEKQNPFNALKNMKIN